MIQKVFNHALDWFEIPVADADRAQEFYETIFQMKMERTDLPNGLKLVLFPVKEGSIGGALACHYSHYKPSHAGTVVYLNANPNLSEILDKVEAAGGKVLLPKTQVSENFGYMALIQDSEGNRVGLHSKG